MLVASAILRRSNRSIDGFHIWNAASFIAWTPLTWSFWWAAIILIRFQASPQPVQPLGRWPVRMLGYQGDDTTRPQLVLRSIRSLISGTVRVRKHSPRLLPAPSFSPPLFMFHCVFYPRHLFFFPFSAPPTSLGPPTEGWWGSEPAALPGLASLLIGVHLVSPAAMNAAVLLPSHRHFFLGTLQRFFAHPSAVFKLLLWLEGFFGGGVACFGLLPWELNHCST